MLLKIKDIWEELWLHNDRLICTISNDSVIEVTEIFEQEVLFNRGDINWIHCMLDLSSIDLFLWRYLKRKAFNNNTMSLEELKKVLATKKKCKKSSQTTYQAAIENFRHR